MCPQTTLKQQRDSNGASDGRPADGAAERGASVFIAPAIRAAELKSFLTNHAEKPLIAVLNSQVDKLQIDGTDADDDAFRCMVYDYEFAPTMIGQRPEEAEETTASSVPIVHVNAFVEVPSLLPR